MEGELQPGADEVAERAGVSRRSIFNHFADLAELYDAVVEAGILRCAPLLEKVSDVEPLPGRIEHLIEVHTQFLEATAPFTRALTAHSMVGPATEQALRVIKDGRRQQREEIGRIFRQELDDMASRERSDVIEALSAALAPLLWEHLRGIRGLSMTRARGVVKRMFVSILENAGVDT